MLYSIEEPMYLVVDLFCGAGGVSTGFIQARGDIARVIACVNHDHKAIESHLKNHPDVLHFEEDIRTLDLTELIALVQRKRRMYPNAKLILWASLECTNFSKAKGGQPRDGDSRTLADHLFRYITGINPDYVMIENVEEFRSWGPLDEAGKPISRLAGEDYIRWCNEVDAHGFRNEWRIMNSADFGAHTSRKRLFGCFARPWLPIIWPETTYSKTGLDGKKKWKAVKEVLDFQDQGKSIFEKVKGYSEKTLMRLYAGLIKHVAGGKSAFLVKWNSMSRSGVYHAPSIEDPSPVVATQGRLGVANVNFFSSYYGNGSTSSIDSPAPTLTTKDRLAMINTRFFIDKQYSGETNHQSVDQPAGSVLPNDKHSLVAAHFLDRNFSGGGQNSSIENPAGTVLPVPKMNLVTAEPFLMHTNFNNLPTSINVPAPVITANRKWSYLINPSWGGNPGSTDLPSPVIVARQDKAPLSVVNAEAVDAQKVMILWTIKKNPLTRVKITSKGNLVYYVSIYDSEIMLKIIEFMAVYGIVDIKMRMLKVLELKLIQGFPSDYILEGSQADQKKFIGNSVVPHVVKSWIEAMAAGQWEEEQLQQAA